MWRGTFVKIPEGLENILLLKILTLFLLLFIALPIIYNYKLKLIVKK